MVKSVATAALTVVPAVAELLAADGSEVVVATIAVLFSAPAAEVFTTSVNMAGAPEARLAIVHVTVPPAPTAGVVHSHPATEVSETNVVPAGSVSFKLTPAAAEGPALLTVIV
jgi:hypothetical protein